MRLILTLGLVLTVAASSRRSGDWIDFDFSDHRHLFVATKINGHDATVQLLSGVPVSSIDKGLAASIGRAPGADTAGLVHDLQIQLGDVMLHDTAAGVVDMTPIAKRIGHPVSYWLGDALFTHFAVDI